MAAITAVLCLLPACAVYTQPLNNSKEAADDMTRRLEGALSGSSAARINQNVVVQAARCGNKTAMGK
jgi:hypothetical protein